ncbi:MAG TPA: hypothetical protein VEL76_24040 [Gemmataceae bacterium]|nr:hypothetical protein [Gemmataceae bacterium]
MTANNPSDTSGTPPDSKAPAKTPPAASAMSPFLIWFLLLGFVPLRVGLSVGAVYLLWVRDQSNGALPRQRTDLGVPGSATPKKPTEAGAPAAEGSARPVKSLAVLPIALPAEYRGDYVKKRIATLNAELPAAIEKATGVPRVGQEEFAGLRKESNPWEVGRELGVDVVLTVAVASYGVEAHARLIEIPGSLHLVSKTFELRDGGGKEFRRTLGRHVQLSPQGGQTPRRQGPRCREAAEQAEAAG